MDFEYNYLTTSVGNIEIKDSGNCALMAKNILDKYYFLIIKTVYGRTDVFEYGPIFIDSKEIPENVFCSFKQFDYNQYKITNTIDKFLNDGKKNIVEANETDFETIQSYAKNMIDFLKRND